MVDGIVNFLGSILSNPQADAILGILILAALIFTGTLGGVIKIVVRFRWVIALAAIVVLILVSNTK
jgi:hypothetical protein